MPTQAIAKNWFKPTFGFEQAGRSRMSWNPKFSMPSQTLANTEGLTVVLIFLYVLWGGARERAPRDRQVNLSKMDAHSVAPTTQLGRAIALGSIIDHVWFVEN